MRALPQATVHAALETSKSPEAPQVRDVNNQDVRDLTNEEIDGNNMTLKSPLFSSVSVPLGSKLNSKIKGKIWANEYVVLALPCIRNTLFRIGPPKIVHWMSHDLRWRPRVTQKINHYRSVGLGIPHLCCYLLREESKGDLKCLEVRRDSLRYSRTRGGTGITTTSNSAGKTLDSIKMEARLP